MNRDEAKEYILDHTAEYFTADNSGKGYICPICGSGTGKTGTGITTKDGGKHFTCWAGCFTSADIFEIVGIERGLTTFTQQIEYLADYFRLSLDELPKPKPKSKAERAAADFSKVFDWDDEISAEQPPTPKSKQRETEGAGRSAAPVKEKAPKDETETDLTNFFLQANTHIQDTDYHRGLSLETLNRFKVGFVSEWKHPKAPAAVPTSPRLIIPTSKSSYLARDTRAADQIPEQAKDYTKSKVGKVHIFNEKALAAADRPIFIVEGEIDAMSIEEVGGAAVAMGSTAYKTTLLQAVERDKPRQPIIIALDNDKAGRETAHALKGSFEKIGVKVVVISDLFGEYKDANEMLMKDRSQLEKIVSELTADPENWERTKYLDTFADKRIDAFTNWIREQGTTKPYISTGFKELDTLLNGGLYNEKLYAVGAISSLGKTTLVMQIADHIARLKRDVLIFSLEMGEFELTGKSISRLTYEITQREGGDQRNAKTDLGVTMGERWNYYSKKELDTINAAIVEYRDEIGRNKKIVSSINGYTVDSIQETVEKHISFTGRKPVVVVDYLQILESTDLRLSDKQKLDHDITALKRLAVQYKTPVVVVSSLNRQNYKAPISFEAFKESGAIEYSVDVLIGLQLKGVGTPDFDVDQAKQADPREIELVILKQRQGKTGIKLGFNFYPLFNFFEETGVIENDHYKDEDESGSGKITVRYNDRPKVNKAAFKQQWIELSVARLNNDYSYQWLTDQEWKLLETLDRGTDLYFQYFKKYKADMKKAEKETGEQSELKDE